MLKNDTLGLHIEECFRDGVLGAFPGISLVVIYLIVRGDYYQYTKVIFVSGGIGAVIGAVWKYHQYKKELKKAHDVQKNIESSNQIIHVENQKLQNNVNTQIKLYGEENTRIDRVNIQLKSTLNEYYMFQISDDEIVENLMLDPRYQYALHTTSFEEQPMSDKTLSRFRKRCYDYEQETGVDLIHDCVADLGSKIAKMMKINPRIHCMDSMMIEANIKNLSRTELLYSCIAKLACRLHNWTGTMSWKAWSIITARMILTAPSIIVTVLAQRL